MSMFSSKLLSSKIANQHLNVLLLALFGIYTYRDLWTLLTFNRKPLDEVEGSFLWLKIACLAVAAIVVPVTAPRRAYPLAIDDLTSEVNPEETASILSLLTHSYMDSFIFRLYRKSTPLTQDELPPLAENDRSDVLMPDILTILDPTSKKPQYLFWGLLRAYSGFISLSFVAPIGIKQVLSYLEHGGDGAIIRPWVWVSWLFLGPFLKAIFSQLYTYIAVSRSCILFYRLVNYISNLQCRNRLQIEGIMNQLLLRHSLRIRIASGSLPDNEEESNNFMGKLNNLAASDVAEIAGFAEFWIVFLCFPVELVLFLWFLYEILHWSAFVGFAFMLLCVPLPGYISQLMRGTQLTKKQKTDARVQSVTEALSILRMAKLFGWEARLQSLIETKRRDELSYMRKSNLYGLLNSHINLLIPVCTMMITYAFYSLFKKNNSYPLVASVVFSSMAIFEMLRARMQNMANNIPTLISAKLALDRLDKFLRKTELLDTFCQQPITAPSDPCMTGFRNSVFKWSGPNNHNFELKIEGDIVFHPNSINLIVGPTGSGKTSLLLALLGEMQFVPTGPNSYYNLPREGGVSYAAQESWIQNDTIRNNILFGSRFDEERYNNVLYQCGLERDLSLFEAGDMTEVGEKGFTLRFLWQARVTLARAVYSSAKTVLLDDPLSALDVHTAKWIVDKCLKGKLMQERTVLVVTHNTALLSPLARHVVGIALDGKIIQGTVADVILNHTILAAQLIKSETGSLKAHSKSFGEEQPMQKELHNSQGALVLAEEMEIGHVSWKAFKLYLNGLNKRPMVFFWGLITMMLLNALNYSLQSWFLGYWSSQYDSQPASSVSVSWFLSVYAGLLLSSMTMYSFAYTLWTFGSIRASQIIHRSFINSIMTSTFRWLDTTPTSRIMIRATADIRSIDDSLAFGIWRLIEASVTMFVNLGSIMIFAPLFLLPGVTIAMLAVSFGQMYLSAQLPLRRLMSINKAPILGNFAAAVAGLVSIRAFGAEDMFLKESRMRIDAWLRPGLPSFNVNRWIGIRVDALAGIFTAALGAYLVYGNNGTSAANTGFSMTMAVGFTSLTLIWIRIYNATELEANSLERVRHYLVIEHEDEAHSERVVPPAYWPASGALQVEGLCARYSKDGPEVLHDLTFFVRSGEHIGIVGRTGSGKSSLTLALLRAIPTSGQVTYDGVSTEKLNLDVLRSNITISPQVPELLSGTLRSNLDPFLEHDDSRLNDALRSAGLFALQSQGNQLHAQDTKLGLDSEIRGGGSSNLSVGQRQIIALARAIVRENKLLIFDEDHETDSKIQDTLRHELGNDVTLITVAHRLGTVMDYDRIMVLEEGRIIEFDSPKRLLEKEGGVFRGLVDESADRAKLYAMVN
ncbi:P-loop containing nucleoside triphosphate hydrolase protein [Lentinula aff. lateritia]|uniref:P-loop containing nucleoside triphosphate hydrolase protein n=1 Tax=Lentinula aff. lateritia TaxID=2804960 RepID=A0ACC1UDD6_9AGAR|nr:P-loop containing nucleoside triphosphate hydrolase protein [Lentinula aff. lateritia]